MPIWTIRHIPDAITPLLEAGRPWLAHYGLAAVGIGLFTETLVFTGAIVPGFAILVAAGYLVASGEMPAGSTLLAAWAGALAGDQVSYWLGRTLGFILAPRYKSKADRLRQVLEQEGGWLLLWYHYSAVYRAVLPAAAGLTHYSARRYATFDSIGVLLWVLAGMAIGYSAHGAVRSGGNVAQLAISGVTAALVTWVTFKIWRALRRLTPRDTTPLNADEHS